LAGINYIKALDALYHLVQKVPVEFHGCFLYSHNREESRFRLLSLKADELKEQELSIEKHINNKINSGKNIVQHFFEGINHEFVLKGPKALWRWTALKAMLQKQSKKAWDDRKLVYEVYAGLFKQPQDDP